MSERTTLQNVSDTTSSTLTSQDNQAKKIQPVDSEDSERFKQMVKQKEVQETKQEERSPKLSLGNIMSAKQSQEEPSPQLNMAFALSNLPTPLQLTPQNTAIISPSEANNHIVTLQKIIEAVAETLAISTKKDQNQEIRIVLKENILPDTEIRINAANHQLIVQFITASGHANQWLDQRRLAMQTELERVLKRPVDLSLLFSPQNQDPFLGQENHHS